MWVLIISALTYANIYTAYEMYNNKNYKQVKKTQAIKLAILIYIHAVIYFITAFSIIFFMSDSKPNKNVILAYVIYLVILMIHWTTNNNTCYLTESINIYFGFPIEDNFRTPLDIIYDKYPKVSISQRIQNEYMTICSITLISTILYLRTIVY